MPFRHPVTVPFDEADPRGILFYGRIHILAHRAFEEFVVGRVVPRWEDWFLSDAFIVPIRQATATYHRPMRPGQRYVAEVEVRRIGTASFDVGTRFLEADGDGALCAETLVTHVFADPARFSSIQIPAPIRSRLEAQLAQQ
jgi:acyl-CoA thioesterase FadM